MRGLLNNWIFRVALLLVILSWGNPGQGQKTDVELIKKAVFANSRYAEPARPQFYLPASTRKVVRYNPISLMVGGLMFLYQTTVSPHLMPGCLYSPSCSAYSVQLLDRYGLIAGVFFTADRLTRCNRLAGMDIQSSEFQSVDHKVHESVERYCRGHGH